MLSHFGEGMKGKLFRFEPMQFYISRYYEYDNHDGG